jgi:hypothetical protein
VYAGWYHGYQHLFSLQPSLLFLHHGRVNNTLLSFLLRGAHARVHFAHRFHVLRTRYSIDSSFFSSLNIGKSFIHRHWIVPNICQHYDVLLMGMYNNIAFVLSNLVIYVVFLISAISFFQADYYDPVRSSSVSPISLQA